MSTHCVRAAPSIFCCECLFHCTMLLWTQSSVIDNSLLFKCSKSQQWNIHWKHVSNCFCFYGVALTLFVPTPYKFYTLQISLDPKYIYIIYWHTFRKKMYLKNGFLRKKNSGDSNELYNTCFDNINFFDVIMESILYIFTVFDKIKINIKNKYILLSFSYLLERNLVH